MITPITAITYDELCRSGGRRTHSARLAVGTIPVAAAQHHTTRCQRHVGVVLRAERMKTLETLFTCEKHALSNSFAPCLPLEEARGVLATLHVEARRVVDDSRVSGQLRHTMTVTHAARLLVRLQLASCASCARLGRRHHLCAAKTLNSSHSTIDVSYIYTG